MNLTHFLRKSGVAADPLSLSRSFFAGVQTKNLKQPHDTLNHESLYEKEAYLDYTTEEAFPTALAWD